MHNAVQLIRQAKVIGALLMLAAVGAGNGAERPAAEIRSGSATLAVRHMQSGYGILLKWRSSTVWAQTKPAALELVDAAGNARWVEASYGSARSGRQGILCSAVIELDGGARFLVDDTYRTCGRNAFSMVRQVTVASAMEDGAGFSTRFLLTESNGARLDAFDVLAPGVWYGRNHHVSPHAIGGDKTDSFFYIREDRLASPFVMAMDRQKGIAISLGHRSPDAQTFKEEDFLSRIIDDRMQFGSLGLQRTDAGTGIGFLFPGSEGEKTYISGGSSDKRWALRSHPVKTGVRHSYSLIIRLDQHNGYPQAVRDHWRFFYGVCSPPIVRADLKKVYGDNVDLLAKFAQFRQGAPGLPFSVGLDGEAGMYCYQMGFVGGQIACAYHLYRSGILDGRYDRRKMGEGIIDFWVKNSYDGRTGPNDLPHTWYQPEMPQGSGPGPHWGVMKTERFWRDEPLHGEVFMRTLSDGHLSALRAWEFARDHGMKCDSWLSWAKRFGDWLVKHQNPDGSYYRKYKVTGEPLQESKENTTHPIPFLVHLHRLTGDERYLNAAVRAGEYAWEHIHKPALYVGGTPDNPNVTDKEAVILALDAFVALYDGTKERKWLAAAKQAADFLETWVYVWDVPMPAGDDEYAVFDRIHTAGLSLVATGHSYADYADAASAYQFHRLYRITGDKHYRDVSLLLFHNTKQLLDTDGSKGYGHPALQVEGIGLSLLRGRGARVWLPWVTVAHIDPIAQLVDSEWDEH